ncbi:NADH-quinone oxidoreductase subunit J family protein [Phycisphaera mikurensis]|uniref:NADH-quinone oxidoreductase subunit J family protein n=1 Tax=Phycisphaera mikurensis TaxID=547188 RepID=UPI00069F9085|nr:NADH-quinone oxidoreductase subunit J [Phycisphaera mikurensis]MBB6441510.1 NADH-quinone oxidoreductase subunit J [Phycisphaera mikurensis]
MDGVPTQLVLYFATVLGAVALFCLMPRRAADAPFRLKYLAGAGALLGVASVGAAWILLSPLLRGDGIADTGVGASGLVFYYVFSALGIVSAVRVITHPRPVYSALWFVMVVIASSGLFLVLAAEFMAFAMVIIYGGAILVTYMFVIMLATEPRAGDDADDLPDYEQYAREPLWAVATAFVLLAVLLSFIFQPQEPNPLARAASDAEVSLLLDNQAGIDRLVATREAVTAVIPVEASPPPATTAGAAVAVPDAALVVSGAVAPPLDAEDPAPTLEALAEAPGPVTNLQRVGLDLFQANPLAVELAGVILLLSLVGAVVIANTQVPREDDADDPSRGRGRKPTEPIEQGPEKAGIGGAEVVQVA